MERKTNIWKLVFAGIVLICLGTTWFTGRNIKVPSFQRLNIKYAVANVTLRHSESEAKKTTRTQKSQMGYNWTVWSGMWSTRAVELQESCKKTQSHNLTTGVKWSKIIVNDKYKFLFCTVPKIACTNIKRVLLSLDGKMTTKTALELDNSKVHIFANRYLKTLSAYSNEDITFRLRNYRKVIFVREPLERLVSAYRSKFQDKSINKNFHLNYGRKIVRKYRLNPSKDSLLKGNDVTFSEFVQFIQDLIVKKKDFDVHWRRMIDSCYPCQIPYDIIGKHETIDEDMRFLLKELGAEDVVQFPSRSTDYYKPKSSDVVLEYYKQITFSQIKSLWDFYYADAFLFGYKFPQVLGTLNSTSE